MWRKGSKIDTDAEFRPSIWNGKQIWEFFDKFPPTHDF